MDKVGRRRNRLNGGGDPATKSLGRFRALSSLRFVLNMGSDSDDTRLESLINQCKSNGILLSFPSYSSLNTILRCRCKSRCSHQAPSRIRVWHRGWTPHLSLRVGGLTSADKRPRWPHTGPQDVFKNLEPALDNRHALRLTPSAAPPSDPYCGKCSPKRVVPVHLLAKLRGSVSDGGRAHPPPSCRRVYATGWPHRAFRRQGKGTAQGSRDFSHSRWIRFPFWSVG